MEPQQMVGYAFLAVGLADFVVVPRVLLAAWNRAGREQANGPLIVRVLRISGLICVLVGALFVYRIIKI